MSDDTTEIPEHVMKQLDALCAGINGTIAVCDEDMNRLAQEYIELKLSDDRRTTMKTTYDRHKTVRLAYRSCCNSIRDIQGKTRGK